MDVRCPYCGAEMEKGVIESPQEISWKTRRHFLSRAKFHPGSIVLAELSLRRGSAVRAFCCRACEKIVIDYRGSCEIEDQP